MDMTLNFISVVTLLSIGMMIWACIEVGSNDATNLINAVFGARVLKRKNAVLIAGIFVILGATFSSPVMDTVRKGIFDLSVLDAYGAISIFIAAYFVNTVLLYTYSGYGLPVSTTATLVFALAGGAVGVTQGFAHVNWATMSKVVSAIFISILFSGVAAFFVQRIFRGAIRKDSQKHDLVLLHGPWITGIIMVSLSWFMVVKGLKAFPEVKQFQKHYFGELGTFGMLFTLWAGFTLACHMLLIFLGQKGTKYLFHVTSVLGMICMSFAFGQNDLANCASPGLAIWMIWKEGLQTGSKLAIPLWTLFGCGFLMFLGMCTKRSQRVTRAEINTASQQSKINLYAPKWCIAVGRFLTRNSVGNESKGRKEAVEEQIRDVAPKPARDEEGKKIHYDPLRASVILSVSACIIAFASGLGLPVSTTYVGFAAVIATGWGDRVFTRGRSDLKMGRAIWVVTSWLMGALIAATAAAILAFIIYKLEYIGLIIAFASNFTLREFFKRRTEEHEKVYHHKKKEAPKKRPPNELEVKTSRQMHRRKANLGTSQIGDDI